MDASSQMAEAPTGPALTRAQRAALAHVRAVARRGRLAALASITATLAGCGVLHDPAQVTGAIATGGRLTLNFHPDRLLADGRTVAVALAEEGVYRSQFETGISNGGLFAYPGGERDRWEEVLFGGAYQAAGVRLAERPVYGGLDLLGHPEGTCPRFGSCHLRLRPTVLARATLCFGDSHLGPTVVGTTDVFEPMLAAMLRATQEVGTCLGVPGLDAATLVRTLLARRHGAGWTAGEPTRSLDDYVEAQVHGGVRLGRDVEALVADPSFRGTACGAVLADLARRYGFPLYWHHGFALPVDRVDPEFRGPAIPPLAARVLAEFGRPGARIDAALIGRAAASLVTEPARWADRGPAADTRQHLKQLWHVLVRYGEAF
ncbi:Protein of unknown function [Micromonospora pallida]|uniref:DUF3626 domain-containing protein n=1 Tax=Micromonospora pallida TaxID=145854 RepID=A0A1C6S3U5_9ACTN|nr:DUF3626 domain-containing protein [Micromonospora pallida]SCL23924.1 Protein of unknown function [Micromonospora pallida]